MGKWLLCICLCIWALPAHTQWYKHAKNKHLVGSSHASQTSSLITAIRRAAWQANNPRNLLPLFSKSILKIKETDVLFRWNALEGNAFVLEEIYQGEKYLWGVTATHYLFQKPALKLPNHQLPRVYFEIQGNAGMNDISLFPLPSQIHPDVVPLQLAEDPAQEGDELFSVGYWNGKLHIDMHRTVQKITPTRLVTSLELDPDTKREGTCGSPVLNQDGQVVGVHAGNSPLRQIGFVIPIQHIRQALEAYHQQGVFTHELLFKGVSLGPIQINQSVTRIELFSGSTKIGSFDMFQRISQVDYAHLENVVNTSGADRIVFWINQNPLSTRTQDQHYYEWSISYNLNTGTITHTLPIKRLFP